MSDYVMTAEENYDPAHVAAIAALTSYFDVLYCTDQNYQGIQWDAVRRNLMYVYTEVTPETPTTNVTGYTIWDGATAIAPGDPVDPTTQRNMSVAVKNIDTGTVTFFPAYDADNLVPAGIGGSDGTYRRYTKDFLVGGAFSSPPTSNGPGMTDPYTGNFWVNSQSCQLYCFRLEDDYSQIISPLFPENGDNNDVMIVGFTDNGATSPWAFAREVDMGESPATASLYLVPRLLTAPEIAADYLLAYATYAYPVTGNFFVSYNREVFDHAGNMYLFSCSASGGKNFRLYRFSPPTAANYPTPAVGGGFTNITPWGPATGPNADGTDYTLARPRAYSSRDFQLETAEIIPLYLPATDDLVLIEKFFPCERTAASVDPALMFWSCTYVGDPAGTPTFDHHSAFVTGYMTAEWEPTDIDGAAYAVSDAFTVNDYLGQSDYLYDIDYTKRWFFFVCTKMTGGVSDGVHRIVLVEYSFVSGAAPSVVQVVDEQGWDDEYPDYGPQTNNVFAPYTDDSTAAVALSMQTFFNPDKQHQLWDSGIHDPETGVFWWSGGASDFNSSYPFFALFDEQFSDRVRDSSYLPGPAEDGNTKFGATPPFMTLSFSGGGDGGITDQDLTIRVWGFSLDDHDFAVFRLGPSESLVFDLTTKQWAEWSSPELDYWRAHVGQNWIGATGSVTHGSDIVTGDDTEGVLYILDPTAGADDDPVTGEAATFTRRATGYIDLRGRTSLPCNAVQLAVSLGAPSKTGAKFTLRTSDDTGHTWTDHGDVVVPAGDQGTTVEWRALGLMRQPGRLFQIDDDGAAVRISGGELR